MKKHAYTRGDIETSIATGLPIHALCGFVKVISHKSLKNVEQSKPCKKCKRAYEQHFAGVTQEALLDFKPRPVSTFTYVGTFTYDGGPTSSDSETDRG